MKAAPFKAMTNEKGIVVSYVPHKPEEATHLRLVFPGPLKNRFIPVRLKGRKMDGREEPVWVWNGDIERPALSPSIKTTAPFPEGDVVCHSFVKDGMAEFCGDCSHELAGQRVPLEDVD